MIKNEVLLKDLCALGAVGGNPFDYFEDIGVKEVALYGNDDLVSIVWAYGYWSKVKVRYVFGDCEKDVAINVGERIRFPELHINENISVENLPVVVTENPKKNLSNAIHLKKLIAYSRIKRVLLDNVLTYKKNNPTVKIVLLGLPSLFYVKNKSEYERNLLACKGNEIIEKEKICSQIDERRGEVSSGENILKNAVFSTYKLGKVYFLQEKLSKYVNVKNGYRSIPNQPKKYAHTVYTFGNSLCMGMYTDDRHTMQYQLQKRLNEYQKNKVIYKEYTEGGYIVLNTGNGGHPNYYKMWKSIEYHKPKNKDVIVLVTWFNEMFQHNLEYAQNFEFCFPQKETGLFDRPHNYGEYVWTDRVHLNDISYIKMGDCLADKIIKIIEKDNSDSDNYSTVDWDVILPDVTKSKYWKQQYFAYIDYLEYVRCNALVKTKSYAIRWLNFKVKKKLLVGEKYKIIITMKYEENVSFKAFFHGQGNIEYLPIQNLEANEWTTIIYDYTPEHDHINWLSLSATNFISAGRKLCIKRIYIVKNEINKDYEV